MAAEWRPRRRRRPASGGLVVEQVDGAFMANGVGGAEGHAHGHVRDVEDLG